MINIIEPKPCENYHPLPCGLDVDCEVPPKFYDVDKTDEEIWEEYQHYKEADGVEVGKDGRIRAKTVTNAKGFAAEEYNE